ncbi:GDP-fucose protein O-fucosyltransferase [Cynara cardunculus var. scolymus]|uniref:O-fucosyltransferase family protein n=1 Tax=Cynara cardunculus var. scolymus TaxID=59895 RepID=A0A118K2A5_CYNCS|nr:GDP-fucose protein O-fucosyltransferase [Cynara cardunculus var. scolymus]
MNHSVAATTTTTTTIATATAPPLLFKETYPSTMKKKPHHHNNAVYIAIGILQSAILYNRRRIHLHHLLPFISAVAGCILFLFAVLSFLSPPINHHHFRHSRSLSDQEIEVQSNAGKPTAFLVPPSRTDWSVGRNLWRSSQSQFYSGCSEKNPKFLESKMKTNPHRFLLIATSGGLNQQRTGITDAVVAAYILNATLVVPKLDQKSYWKDQSRMQNSLGSFETGWILYFSEVVYGVHFVCNNLKKSS